MLMHMFYTFKRSDFFIFKNASLFIYFVAFFNLFEITLGKYVNQKDFYYFIIYSIMEYSILYFIFKSQNIYTPRFYFPFLKYSYLILLILFCYHIDTISMLQLNAYLSTASFVQIVSFSFFWFRDGFINFKYKSLLGVPFFYFISGMILYYSGVITLYLLITYIDQNDYSLKSYWILNLIFSLIYRVLLIVCIWKARKI